MSIEQERAAFEAWARRARGFSDRYLARQPDGYENEVVEASWVGWQARAALAAPADNTVGLELDDWVRATGAIPFGGSWHAELAAMIRDAAAPQVPADSVPMPTNADKAAAMALIGEAWLRENAPERLRAPQPAGPAPRWLTKEEIDPLIEQARDAFYPADMNPHFERCLVWLALRAAGVKEPPNAVFNGERSESAAKQG